MERPHNHRLFQLLCAGLVLGSLLACSPVFHSDFTTYDDPVYVSENPVVQSGLGVHQLAWAFTTGCAGNWHPLTWVSHMLDCQIYGLNAGGHHATSLLFHLANTLLLFGLLRRLTGTTWRSAVVAALFAWHPLHVESVAWISERKDVLSAFFWFLTLWAYVWYVQSSTTNVQTAKSRSLYSLALFFFVLGLLSKPMVVTLPFVLLLLDYWPLGRISDFKFQISDLKPASGGRQVTTRFLILEKIPFLVLAVASSVVTFLVQKSGGAVASNDAMPLPDRAANAAVAYISYLRKTFWPDDLAVFYPLPASVPAWQVMGALLLLLAITAAVVMLRWSRPWLLVGWLWFLGTLVPVIGLVQVGLQSMADRYTYIPLVGIFIMLVWSASELAEQRPQFRVILGGTTVLALAACLTLTWFQARTWRNAVTLFTHALDVADDRFVALNNLARALGKLGRYDEAAADFKAALQIQPDAPLPLYNLGLISARNSRLEEAKKYYETALQGHPDYAPARFELANILAVQGQLQAAANHYRECLRTEPEVAEIRLNLARVLAQLGDLAGAAEQYEAVLRLDPDQPEAEDEFGGVLQKLGRRDAARIHYAEAVRLKPDFVHALVKLGFVLASQGQFEEAKVYLHKAAQLEPANDAAWYNLGGVLDAQERFDDAAAAFAEVVRLKPQDADAHARLGTALARAGKAEAAVPQLREAIRLKPDSPEPLRALATILATNPKAGLRNGAEAVQLAERANELTEDRDPRVLSALDEAYAEAGRFEDAIKTAQKAREQAAVFKQPALAEQAAKRLELYRAGKPWRE